MKPLLEALRASRKTLLLILVVATTTIALSTIASMWLSKFSDLHFPSIGTIKTAGVKVYWDANLENETKEVQWGTIYPGSSNNVTLFVRSVSNIDAVMELKAANWTFRNGNGTIAMGPSSSSSYMNLTWDYDNATLGTGETVTVTMTLSVEDSLSFRTFLVDNDVREFSVDIIIWVVEK